MTKVTTAVIGAGLQGRRHAEKFTSLPDTELVAVVDSDPNRAAQLGSMLGVSHFTSCADLPADVDAVAIATPTTTHFEIASKLLANGVHVLIEKPITATVEEARDLVSLAEENGVILQVGHLERFNPAVVELAKHVDRPQFIESNRIAPYKIRSLDVSVVLDLMIHDIDLIHSLVGAPMESVDAVGRSVFSDTIDVANARIRFVNGCVANITSSRISLKTERMLRVFQADSYLSADLHKRALTTYKKRDKGPVSGPDDVVVSKQEFPEGDAMLAQAQAFRASIAGGPAPLVSGRTAMDALATATIIGEILTAQRLS